MLSNKFTLRKIGMMLLIFSLVFTGLGASLGTPVSYAADEGTIVYVKSDGSDTSGDGTQENPFATLQRAYQAIPDNGTGTIYIKDNITLVQDTAGRFVVFDKIKNVTITTDPESSETAVIQRGGPGGIGVGTLIDLSGGQLTLNNIIFDGKDIKSYGRVINVSKSLIIEEGTILRNNNSEYGGTALYLNGGNIEMSGGEIKDNKFSGLASDRIKSAIYIAKGSFHMSGGQIIGNSAGGELISKAVHSLLPATHAS